MPIISFRKATPLPGKAALLAERGQTLAGIQTRHGARRARVFRVVSGDGFGQYWLATTFDDAASMADVWEKTQAERFAKEAAFKSTRMLQRLVAADETVAFSLAQESVLPAFLRRRVEEGRG